MKRICKTCGIEFDRKPSQRGIFCSPKCYHIDLTKRTHTVSEEAKQKLREHHNPLSNPVGKDSVKFKRGDSGHYTRTFITTYGISRICSCCGETEGRLDLHHIDKDRTNNDLSNLMILCVRCHTKLHHANGDLL